VTRARVRLLGPCFKTGQVDTDLLAVDCHANIRAARIRRATPAAFRRKAPKQRPDATLAFARRAARALRHTPHERRTSHPTGAHDATPSDTRYNASDEYETRPGYLRATLSTVAPVVQSVTALARD
jgi:hypothetical protein